jgi:hypothetical protein
MCLPFQVCEKFFINVKLVSLIILDKLTGGQSNSRNQELR